MQTCQLVAVNLDIRRCCRVAYRNTRDISYCHLAAYPPRFVISQRLATRLLDADLPARSSKFRHTPVLPCCVSQYERYFILSSRRVGADLPAVL